MQIYFSLFVCLSWTLFNISHCSSKKDNFSLLVFFCNNSILPNYKITTRLLNYLIILYLNLHFYTGTQHHFWRWCPPKNVSLLKTFSKFKWIPQSNMGNNYQFFQHLIWKRIRTFCIAFDPVYLCLCILAPVMCRSSVVRRKGKGEGEASRTLGPGGG